MQKLLNEISNEEIVALYFGNGDKFFCGKILAVNEDFVVLRSYTPYGVYDGYIVKRINELRRIEQNSKYLKSLSDMVKCKHTDSELEIIVSGNCLMSMLCHSVSSGQIVSIELEECDELIIGYVTKIEDNIISIKQYNEYGEYDGVSFIYLEDIISLYIDSENERKVEAIKKDN